LIENALNLSAAARPQPRKRKKHEKHEGHEGRHFHFVLFVAFVVTTILSEKQVFNDFVLH
jgi:hypothetical protein